MLTSPYLRTVSRMISGWPCYQPRLGASTPYASNDLGGKEGGEKKSHLLEQENMAASPGPLAFCCTSYTLSLHAHSVSCTQLTIRPLKYTCILDIATTDI